MLPVTSPLRVVTPIGDRCGEGAVWSAAEQALYWTDINRFFLHRWDWTSGSVRSWAFDQPVCALAVTPDPGRLLVAIASGVIFWRPATDERIPQGFTLPGWPQIRLNDGRPDPRGNFWVGSMKNNVGQDGEEGKTGTDEGKLFRITPQGVTIWKEKIGISNTVCWSPDDRTMIFGDTVPNALWRYDYDPETGDIANEQPYFVGFPRGKPDGSAMDAEGCLWNTRFGGACVVRVTPEGRVAGILEMPVSNITTCTFGGPDLKTLFITSARIVGADGERLAGSLFAVSLSVPGLPERVARL